MNRSQQARGPATDLPPLKEDGQVVSRPCREAGQTLGCDQFYHADLQIDYQSTDIRLPQKARESKSARSIQSN